MTNVMLSKPPAVEKPAHPEQVTEPRTMEVFMSRFGARLGSLLDGLGLRCRELAQILAAESKVLGKRCNAAWRELGPALGRAWHELASGLGSAARAWKDAALSH